MLPFFFFALFFLFWIVYTVQRCTIRTLISECSVCFFALLLFIFRDRKDWWLRHTQTHTTLSLTQTSNERQQHSTKMDFLLATEHGKYIKPTSCKWFVHFISFHQFSFVVRCFFGALFSIWQMNLAMSVVVLCTQNHCMCVKEQFNWNECKENKKKVNSKIRRRNNTQEKKSKKNVQKDWFYHQPATCTELFVHNFFCLVFFILLLWVVIYSVFHLRSISTVVLLSFFASSLNSKLEFFFVLFRFVYSPKSIIACTHLNHLPKKKRKKNESSTFTKKVTKERQKDTNKTE